MTPSATPKDSRFMIDATSGMSRLRKTMREQNEGQPDDHGQELGQAAAQ